MKILVLAIPAPRLTAEIVPTDEPEPVPASVPLVGLDTPARGRAEIAEARRRIVSPSRPTGASDLLPRLDLVAGYARRGLAGRENPNATGFEGPVVVPNALAGGWGRSFGTIRDNEFPDASVGVAFSIPLGNRSARASLAIAKSTLSQAAVGVSAAEQQVSADVRNAVFALESARQRIEAARASRAAAETQLFSEQERFQAGLSTNFLVLTRQNDRTNALVTETAALTDYRKAETELSRATGVLLERRHIEIEQPAEATASSGENTR